MRRRKSADTLDIDEVRTRFESSRQTRSHSDPPSTAAPVVNPATPYSSSSRLSSAAPKHRDCRP